MLPAASDEDEGLRAACFLVTETACNQDRCRLSKNKAG